MIKIFSTWFFSVILILIVAIAPGLSRIPFESLTILLVLTLSASIPILALSFYFNKRIVGISVLYEKRDLTKFVKFVEPIYLFIILLQIVRFIYRVDFEGQINFRDIVFYRTGGGDESPFYDSGFEYVIFTSLKFFSFCLIFVARYFGARYFPLLLIYILDCLIHFERSFILSLAFCFIIGDFILKNKSIKSMFWSIFPLASFGVIFYLLISFFRLDSRGPLEAFIENYSIPPRLFNFMLLNDSAHGFYSYGVNTISEIFGPMILFLNNIFGASADFLEATNFFDEFHCIDLFSNAECIYVNAYFTGHFNFYRDFGVFGPFYGLFQSFLISFIALKLARTKELLVIFLFYLYTFDFFMYYFSPSFGYMNFYMPLYIYMFFDVLLFRVSRRFS